MGIEKGFMAIMIAIMMMAIVSQMIPVQAAPTVYTCPVCGEEFTTLAELEAHFADAHPSIPINIIWE